MNTTTIGAVKRSELAGIAVDATEGLGQAVADFVEARLRAAERMAERTGRPVAQVVIEAQERVIQLDLTALCDALADEATIKLTAALEAQARERGFVVLEE